MEKTLEKGISFHRGPTGELGRVSTTRDLERWVKEALGMERFSLKRLSEEASWEGCFTGDHGRYVMKGTG